MSRSGLALTIGFAAEAVRETTPLVHCIAPRAAASFVAEVLYGAGAVAVVMGTSADALAASTTADAVLVDLGTLASEWSAELGPTFAALGEAGRPWALDITRIGRAPLREDRVRSLLAYNPTIVRSSSETLEGGSLDVGEGALVVGESAESVRGGGLAYEVPGLTSQLANIPGIRAAVTALMAACAAVTGPTEAALTGAAWMSLASTRVPAGLGPASLRIALVDALSLVRGDEIADYLRDANFGRLG